LRNRVGYVSCRISGDLSRLRQMRHRAVGMQATDGANIEAAEARMKPVSMTIA